MKWEWANIIVERYTNSASQPEYRIDIVGKPRQYARTWNDVLRIVNSR